MLERNIGQTRRERRTIAQQHELTALAPIREHATQAMDDLVDVILLQRDADPRDLARFQHVRPLRHRCRRNRLVERLEAELDLSGSKRRVRKTRKLCSRSPRNRVCSRLRCSMPWRLIRDSGWGNLTLSSSRMEMEVSPIATILRVPKVCWREQK